MAGSGAPERGRVAATSASRDEAARFLPSKRFLFNALSRESRRVAAVAGASRRQVRHSGPLAGASSPPIRQVPSSQHAMRTAQWQPPRAAPEAAIGRMAAIATSARRNADEMTLRRGIVGGF